MLAVHVDNELNYIGLRSGNSYGGYSVDIDPSVLNHLAVATFGGYWDVYWNGEPSGMIALPVLSAQADELVVGGCGAEDQSYIGWISNFRLWNTIVFWDDVYAFMPVTTNILDEGHPMQPFIRAMTRIHENGTPYITTLNGVTAEQEQ
ncbi:hypothetical protein ROA7745_03225 [Roseovarius aestuarii]|uniref:Uncharacterized protein n=1 Tax=Roseovarius aestuarii TaxID=475083 RepID=A0A1X7BVX1_9RHOB|nr:hypothetical protein ROA7745_03225 [Roseovarius aestuarii]